MRAGLPAARGATALVSAGVAGFLLIAACSAPRPPAPDSLGMSSADAAKSVRTRLYFGLASPQGPIDSAAFALFVDTAITPRFPDGLTVFAAQGQWRGRDGVTIKEPSRVVDIIAGICSIVATVGLLRFWKPKTLWRLTDGNPSAVQTTNRLTSGESPATTPDCDRRAIFRAWLPWGILTVFLLVWGTPQFKATLDKLVPLRVATPGLHEVVLRVPPVAPPDAKPEAAVIKLNLGSATGTGILCAAIVAGLFMGARPRDLWRCYYQCVWRVRFSLLTIAAMLALGNVTKYSGTDATLGLALAHTGSWYPFFGTLLGWLGVALTGSDTASNVLFGSLQKITAEQTGVSPILMAAANSSGGVMGKMVDAQSIVVASTATNWFGHESSILRFVFIHSIVLAALIGILVSLQAYVFPFTSMVVK